MTIPRIVLIGAVESSRIALEALFEKGCAPILLITLPRDRSALHSDFVDLAPLAERYGVPVLHAGDVNSDAVVEHVRELEPDFLFVIGWSRLIGKALRECAAKGVLGYHPTPLPKGRGRSALSWTILLGMPETAGSLFWIDEGVDSGPIAAQTAFALPARVDLPDLYARHIVALRAMLGSLLHELKIGRMPAMAQDKAQASYFARRRPEDGQIDWSADVTVIDRLVRAVTRPYPGAFTSWRGRRMTIWRGEPVDKPEWHAEIGQLFLIEDGALYVRCGDGGSYRIDDYEIQTPPGVDAPAIAGQPRLGTGQDI